MSENSLIITRNSCFVTLTRARLDLVLRNKWSSAEAESVEPVFSVELAGGCLLSFAALLKKNQGILCNSKNTNCVC